MCEICEKVRTVDDFTTPRVYLDCLKYIQSLVDSGYFQFESKDCNTDKVKDENGRWFADVISHVIKCKNCGQRFSCVAVPHRGGGSFSKE